MRDVVGSGTRFFYAGARSLFVSHRSVESEPTVELFTKTFAALRGDPSIGRAEALRRSMVRLIANGGAHAHPATWAPFVVVGEGGMGLALATAATTVTTCKSRQLLLQKIESPRVVQRKIGELRALGDCRRHPGYLASVFRVLSSIMPIPVRQSRSGSLLGTRRHDSSGTRSWCMTTCCSWQTPAVALTKRRTCSTAT